MLKDPIVRPVVVEAPVSDASRTEAVRPNLVMCVDALPLGGRRPVAHDHVDDAHAAGQQHARVGLPTPRVQPVHLSLGKCAATVQQCGGGAARA